jgi:hypothetical protein
MKRLLFLALALWPLSAAAQDTPALVVSTCGSISPLFAVGRPAPLTVDVNGVTCGSATFSGSTITALGKATAAAPSYSEGVANPLSLDLSGNLRETDIAAEATLSSILTAIEAPIPAGTNVIGHVVVDSGAAAVTNSGTFAVQTQVNTGNANVQAHICGTSKFVHVTSATDTQIVAASGSTNIYVCDYAISFGGTINVYLEKATTGTCATLTQIDQTWYGVANAGKAAGNAYYRGLNTGESAQLCLNSTGAGVASGVDVTVYYDQY